MSERLKLQWYYTISGLSLAAMIVGAVLDFQYLLLLPLVAAAIYTLVFHTDKLVYFLAFAVPLSVPVKNIGGGIGMSIPTEPLIFLLFVGVIWKLLMGKTFDRKLLYDPLTLLILLDLAWMGLTAATSTIPLVSAKYVLARAWYVAVFYLALAHLFKKYGAIKVFMWCMVAATSVLVLYTLYNHSKGSFTRTYSYTAMRPFLPDHGMYGAAITFFIPTLLVFGLWGGKLKFNMVGRVGAVIMLAIITAGVILSFTRASWLSLVASLVVLIILLLRIRYRTVLIFGFIATLIALSFQSDILYELSRNKQDSDDDIEQHVKSFSNVTTDPSNLERLNRWSCAIRMFQDKPVFGFGPGTYTYKYAPYQISSEQSIISTHAGDLGNVHSEYLRPLCEEGLPGAIFMVLIVLVAIGKGFHVYYHSSNPYAKFMALAALLALITYFFHGFLNNYSDFDKIAVPLWGMMAILLALHRYHMDEPGETTQDI